MKKRLSRRALLSLAPAVLAGAAAAPPFRDRFLAAGGALNDFLSALDFGSGRLALEYEDAELTPLERFPLNSYDRHEPEFDPASWQLRVEGCVARPGDYSLSDIMTLFRRRQNVRHICIEGWSVVGAFGGAQLEDVLRFVGADLTAPFVEVTCLDDYYTSFDMASCLHPQTLLCDEMYGKPLTRGHGAPLRMHMPTKLGYKSAKYLSSLRVTRERPRYRGLWEDQGYPWHAGL
ncbi:MAG TPA: molybdopterin-dependent oxidoreductase [Vicinamibacterales bacterium]|jgi:DMSO/TMAO reductase YedYZ molybdopterin-dependent catalytic subunit|nr:molybdopterin-dependent oxidoreductase [Vicinamibacterales bacterium]